MAEELPLLADTGRWWRTAISQNLLLGYEYQRRSVPSTFT